VKPAAAPALHESALPHLRPCAVVFRSTDTVAAAIDAVRNARAGESPCFYVVDDERRLTGLVTSHVLLNSDTSAVVESVMRHDAVAIPDWATVLVAAEFFATQPFKAFPVVNQKGELLGQLDTSVFTPDVVSLATRSFDDIFQLVGIHASGSRSAWTSFLDRFPWLMANVGGGLLSALIAARYEALLGSVVVLALFIPVVLALAESVSIQSATLTLQRLHGGAPVRGFLRRVFWQELGAAALLGLGSGIIVGGIAAALHSSALLGVAVGGAISASVLTAGILGLVLPTGLHALRLDPKIAAGPIVLAVADLASLLFYFNLAGWLLGGR
jgi:magnesium transporter